MKEKQARDLIATLTDQTEVTRPAPAILFGTAAQAAIA
jgi:hypothetical protein